MEATPHPGRDVSNELPDSNDPDPPCVARMAYNEGVLDALSVLKSHIASFTGSSLSEKIRWRRLELELRRLLIDG